MDKNIITIDFLKQKFLFLNNIINNLHNHINFLVNDQILSDNNYYEILDRLKEYNNNLMDFNNQLNEYIIDKEFDINELDTLNNLYININIINENLLIVINDYGYNSFLDTINIICNNIEFNQYVEKNLDKIIFLNKYFKIVKIEKNQSYNLENKISLRIINLDITNKNSILEEDYRNIIKNNIFNIIWEKNKALIEIEINNENSVVKYNIFGYFKEDELNELKYDKLIEYKYKNILKYYLNLVNNDELDNNETNKISKKFNNILKYNIFVKEYLNQLSIKDYFIKEIKELIDEININYDNYNKLSKLNLLEIINSVMNENIIEIRQILILLFINDVDNYSNYSIENDLLESNLLNEKLIKKNIKYPIIGKDSNYIVKMNKATAVNYTINSIKKNLDINPNINNINLFIHNSKKILNANIVLDFIKKNIINENEFINLKKSFPNNIRRRIFVTTEGNNNQKIDELSYELKLELLNLNDKIKSKVNEKIKEFRSNKENSKAENYLDGFFKIPFNSFIKEDIFIECTKSNNKIRSLIDTLNQYSSNTIEYDDSIKVIEQKNSNNLFKEGINKSLINEKIFNSELKLNYLKYVEEILENVIYGQYDSKREIKRIIAQWMNGEFDGIVLGFHGPPGVGKTCFAKNGISKCLIDIDGKARPFCLFQLGGATDGNVLEGHNYTYMGSKWGRLVDMLMDSKCMNPIIYFDELDKISETDKGKEIIDILIHLTDKSQNSQIYDRFFSGIDLDFSKCIIIFSYNDANKINRILKDRITEIKINPLKKNEKIIITQKFTLKNISKELNFDCKLTDENIEYIIDTFTNEAGIRKLNEKLYEIFREINLRKLEGNFDYNEINSFLINEILNRHNKVRKYSIHDEPQIGLINGLYASSTGLGGITLIQVQKIISNQSNLPLELTGQQGNVMKESMSCAKTLALNLLTDTEKTNLYNEIKDKQFGLHIHCPDTSTPKDGPSAGLAITAAIYSLLTSKPIKNDIAITGEVDLLGNAKAIGGLDAKINGAIKAGVKLVIFPEENEEDFKKIIEQNLLDSKISYKMVKNIKDVISLVIIQ